MSQYVLDNAWELARQRLALLEEIHDPGTIRRLDEVGVDAGWRVFIPGGGGGSIVRWLCERVGLSGHVLATDIDTRFLEAIEAPNLEVRRHDIANEELPEADFDLVAVRLLLIHLPARERVLERLVRALRPGGWIVLEEYDLFPAQADGGGAWSELTRSLAPALRLLGPDYEWARYLPGRLAGLGLEAVSGDIDAPFFQGGSAVAEFHRLTGEQARDGLLGTGLVPADLFDRGQAQLTDPSFWGMPPAIVVAKGRRPGKRVP